MRNGRTIFLVPASLSGLKRHIVVYFRCFPVLLVPVVALDSVRLACLPWVVSFRTLSFFVVGERDVDFWGEGADFILALVL